MIYYSVVWLSFACPGGWLSGQIPPKWRPILCEVSCESAAFDKRSYADALVDKVGPDAKPKLWKYTGLRREALPVTFNPNTKR